MLTHLALAILAAADTTRPASPSDSVRIVRQLAPVEVRALLTHPRSSQSVHEIGPRALRSYPADRFADVLALQPGVVAIGEALHVRGGRPGETVMVLDGLPLNEPQRGRPADLPLLAIRSVDVVSGMPEPRHPGGLAGVLDFHTIDPTPRFEGALRWQTDGGIDTRFDRWSVGASGPLHVGGLGLAAAADFLLDGTWLPSLRSTERERWAGLSFAARAENQLSGWMKLAPLAAPQRFAVQAFASRKLRRPYDPMWSLNGWFGIDSTGSPDFSEAPVDGYSHYRAADHLATTEERRIGGVATASLFGAVGRLGVSLGGFRTTTITATNGEPSTALQPPVFGSTFSDDPFHVLFGDDGIRRESQSDLLQLRVDAEKSFTANAAVRAGAGASYEDVKLDELDVAIATTPLDAIRSYRAFAAGGFGYLQGRWEREGLVVNPGLRAEYWSAGSARFGQSLPPGEDGFLSISPRIGIAYPLSPRDVFSMAWARAHQAPARDFLYDRRGTISNRQPLGNPALRPSVQISWEAAIKHLLSREWALQSGVFYRDVARQVGARNGAPSGNEIDVRYTDGDQASAIGFEWSLRFESGEARRAEVSYTFMRAWGYESRPEGDPYGALREVRPAPIAEAPLSWDRRHSIRFTGETPVGRHLSVAWSSVVGSPLPWTPKARRVPPTDLSAINTRRLGWTEATNLDLRFSPPAARRLTLALEVRNLFDHRGEIGVTVDGYPNFLVNTLYDDYGAYRTETGLGGGAYWLESTDEWVAVHDPRLYAAPRRVRASLGWSW